MEITLEQAADPWLTRPAVGEQLGGGPKLAERLIDAGELAPAYRIGGRVMVRQSAVDAYLERVRIVPAGGPAR